MQEIRYLTEEELILLNTLLISKYSPREQKGVKFPDLLSSAVNRPKQTVFGKDAYNTMYEKAAAMIESLARNHAFHSANKRVAFTGMVQFLRYNGYKFFMSQKQAEDFTIDIVEHKYTFAQIAQEIEKYSKKL